MTTLTATALHVQGLEKSFKDVQVLRGVDFDVARGSIFALLGSHGAGKTTVVNILATLLKADTGTATLLDTLERRGLVSRLPDPDDRRKVLVALTAEGQQVVDDFLPRVVAFQTAAMAGLSEAEREQLRHHLAVIQETVAELDGDGIAADALPRSKPKQG